MENLRDKTLDLLTRLLEGNMVSVMGDDLIQQFIKDMLNTEIQSQQQPEVSDNRHTVIPPVKNDKTKELNKLDVPSNLRSPFVRWAQRWGVWDAKELKWYEYGPLERHQKNSRTMAEMWQAYLAK